MIVARGDGPEGQNVIIIMLTPDDVKKYTTVNGQPLKACRLTRENTGGDIIPEGHEIAISIAEDGELSRTLKEMQ